MPGMGGGGTTHDPVTARECSMGLMTTQRDMRSFSPHVPGPWQQVLGQQLSVLPLHAASEGRQELARELGIQWILRTPFWGPGSSCAPECCYISQKTPFFLDTGFLSLVIKIVLSDNQLKWRTISIYTSVSEEVSLYRWGAAWQRGEAAGRGSPLVSSTARTRTQGSCFLRCRSHQTAGKSNTTNLFKTFS